MFKPDYLVRLQSPAASPTAATGTTRNSRNRPGKPNNRSCNETGTGQASLSSAESPHRSRKVSGSAQVVLRSYPARIGVGLQGDIICGRRRAHPDYAF